MRVVIVYCLLIVSTSLLAQDEVLFKIITYSQGTTLDGQPVVIGQDVHASASQMFVPEGGRVGIITAVGHTFRLTESMAVSNVNGFVHKILQEEAERRKGRHYGTSPGLEMPLAPENQYSETLEDSTFLFWIPAEYYYSDVVQKARMSTYKSFTVRFSNMYDDSLTGFRVDRNWIVAKYPEVQPKKDKAVLYQVISNYPKARSEIYLITKASEKQRDYVRSQLAPLENRSDLEYIRCALFELNDFKLDMNMSLYRIISRKLGTSDPILQKYLANQISEYHLELMELDR